MSNANPSTFSVGYGSMVEYATITGTTIGAYTKIGQTKDIKGPDSEVQDVKGITNNDSPNNTKESAPGMLEPGTIGWDVVYSKTGYTALMTMLGDGNLYSWRETFADGSTMVAPGYLKKAPVVTKTEDEANVVNVEVKLTGKPVFTAAV